MATCRPLPKGLELQRIDEVLVRGLQADSDPALEGGGRIAALLARLRHAHQGALAIMHRDPMRESERLVVRLSDLLGFANLCEAALQLG